jgi:hypothetical protein
VAAVQQAAKPFAIAPQSGDVQPMRAAANSQPFPVFSYPAAAPTTASSRWTLSTWAFVRRGTGPQLATGGTLGGSQIGARATYQVGERLALSARLYAPLNQANGAEAALGVEIEPIAAVPLRLLAERRQAVGTSGRSAFAILAHGGIAERPVLGPVRLDAYAQAGVVGVLSRDGFVDGAVRLGIPLNDRATLGVGAWAAAQPGIARVDLGPHASYRFPLVGGTARISAEWRMRIAGDARPGSGPALTLATDF